MVLEAAGFFLSHEAPPPAAAVSGDKRNIYKYQGKLQVQPNRGPESCIKTVLYYAYN